MNHIFGIVCIIVLGICAEMQKAADAADISVLFFSAGANFWAIFGQFWVNLGNFGSFLGYIG